MKVLPKKPRHAAIRNRRSWCRFGSLLLGHYAMLIPKITGKDHFLLRRLIPKISSNRPSVSLGLIPQKAFRPALIDSPLADELRQQFLSLGGIIPKSRISRSFLFCHFFPKIACHRGFSMRRIVPEIALKKILCC